MLKYSLLFCLSLFLVSCSSNSTQKSVTIYVSEDQVFSEPLLKDFEKETGIKVNAIYDTEESKSTGVMNRLIAEKNNPQADVYWANEPIRAEVLHQKEILAPYKSPNAKGIPLKFIEKDYYWTGFSARVRLLIVEKQLIHKPHSIFDYTKKEYRANTVIANPLFGTTAVHLAALFEYFGEEKTKTFLTQLKANKVAISTSNGESADFVSSGHYLFSLVDSDDAISRLKSGKNIDIIYPDQGKDDSGAFVLPNAVMMIKNAPHPNMAKKMIDYLLSKESEQKLAYADCAQIPLHKGVTGPTYIKPMSQIKTIPVDFSKVAQKMTKMQPYLKKWLSQ